MYIYIVYTIYIYIVYTVRYIYIYIYIYHMNTILYTKQVHTAYLRIHYVTTSDDNINIHYHVHQYVLC